jgi:hypothetical protein
MDMFAWWRRRRPCIDAAALLRAVRQAGVPSAFA